MRLQGSRASFLILVLTMALAVAALRPALAQAQDDAQRFADLLAQRDNTTSLAGPLSGELVQQEGFSTVNAAGVETADFSATATFVNPAASGEFSWDFGFVFHQTADAGQQIIVDSAGYWYYSPYPGGEASSGDATMVDSTFGATNTLDLVVEGGTALMGINGQFVTAIALPPAVPSDVLVGTGFYANTTEPGRTIGYLDFEIWPLSGEPATVPEDEPVDEPLSVIEIEGSPEPTVEAAETPQTVIEIEGAPTAEIVPSTPEPEPEPEATPAAESSSDAETFARLLELQEQAEATPLAGPFNANLKEEENQGVQSWAGVDLLDFHAQATFEVPPTTSEIPWDIGVTFRTSPAGTLKVVVDALGNWYFSIGDQGPESQGTVSDLITEPGGTNTIDLFVAEERAVFGVNGVLAAMIDLPADAAGGDVAAGSGYYSDQTASGRITPFREFVIRPFDPFAVAPPGTSEEALVPANIEAFSSELANTEASPPLAGPFAGRLVDATPGMVSQAAAGVMLADFAVVSAFTNPEDVETATWDAGIQFRADGDLTHRIILRSNGEISAVQPDGATAVVGLASAYDPEPGAVNALQLFVTNNRALVGVNGELAAVVDLPAEPVASDILVGAAFFGEDFVQGRITSYEGFSVWETS